MVVLGFECRQSAPGVHTLRYAMSSEVPTQQLQHHEEVTFKALITQMPWSVYFVNVP